MTEDIKKILEDFIRYASTDEVEELRGLLEARQGRKGKGLGAFDSSGFAGKMAADIQAQMGFTQENVRRMAIDLVIRLARQKQPNISETELEALVNQMVPGAAYSAAKVPPDILKLMVQHYVLFKTGRMSPDELSGLPNGWQQRYWSVFPVGIKKEINDFLGGKSRAEEFWRGIERKISGR